MRTLSPARDRELWKIVLRLGGVAAALWALYDLAGHHLHP
jgi:hypothetical protein